jgi:ATP-binding cassette subfamily C (CFTR/MRP) protein 1
VLTVAHRLKTILECDRIAVLSDGKLKEVGPPAELLQQPDSSLRSMAQDAGLL